MIELPFRVQDKIQPEPNTGCWLWTGSWTTRGYGNMRLGEKVVRAHRYVFEFYRGSIPDGLTIDHGCKMKCCVNPDHLEITTSGDNTRRGDNPAAINARKTTCIYGHPLTLQRVTHRGRIRRDCVECRKEQNRKSAERHRKRLTLKLVQEG